MKPQSIKKIIDMFASTHKGTEDMEYVRIQNSNGGIRIFTYSHESVCNVFIPDECTQSDCMIHLSKKGFLTELHKLNKKNDVLLGTFLELVVEYRKPAYKVDDLMSNTFNLNKVESFSIDFKALERVYKSMKQASNNIRIDVSTGDNPLIISNEEGDISVLNKII